MYGSETWTLNARLHQRLDGCYTKLLCRIQNLSWKDHPTLKQIYGSIPRISAHLIERRTRFTGHCFRAKQELISDIILWKQSKNRKLTYPDIVSRDSGIHLTDLRNAMADRGCWRNIVLGVSAKADCEAK